MKLVLVIFLLILMGCGGGSEFDEQNAKTHDGASGESISDAERRARESFVKQEAAKARLALQELADEADLALQALDELDAATSSWNEFVTPLSTNDAGRAIASDPDLVTSYLELEKSPPPSTADVDASRRKLQRLKLSLLEQAAVELPSLSGADRETHRSTITAERDRARTDTAALKDNQARVEAWIAAGERNPVSRSTLEEVVRNERIAREEKRAREVADVARHRQEEEDAAFAREQELRRLAFDADVLALLDFSNQPNGYAWHHYRMGDAYRDEKKLIYSATADRPGRPPITKAEYGRRDALARAKYGMGLHDLFRLTCDYNRDIYLDALEIEELLETATGGLRNRLKLGPSGEPLPPPKN